MPKRKPKTKRGKQMVMADEMRKFFKGTLKSGSGAKVTRPAQAKAIGMKVSGQSKGKKKKSKAIVSRVGRALS